VVSRTSTPPADLVRGYRAARELQHLPIPPHLGKELAGYLMRAGTELIAREIDPPGPLAQEASR
jgi:hypothetical protein